MQTWHKVVLVLGILLGLVTLFVFEWALGFITVGLWLNGHKRFCPVRMAPVDCVLTHLLEYPAMGVAITSIVGVCCCSWYYIGFVIHKLALARKLELVGDSQETEELINE